MTSRNMHMLNIIIACKYVSVFTIRTEAQLPADHTGINRIPSVVTHSAPHSIGADLHTTLEL